MVHEKSTFHPRSGHRIVSAGNYLLCLGGYNPDFWGVENDESTNYPLFQELWAFNLTTKRWSNILQNDMPDTLASHSVVFHKHKLWMFGGTSVPFGETSSNDLHTYSPHTRQWNTVEVDGEPPIPSYGVGVCMVGDDLYICGGTTGWQYNINMYRINLDSRKWKHLEPQDTETPAHFPPPSRYRHEIVTDNKRIYVLAGGRASEVYDFECLPAFDIETQVWEKQRTQGDPRHGFPVPRRCHAGVQHGNDVYICGGYNGSEIYADLWKINLVDFCWQKYNTTMPEPAYFHTAAITSDGCMYVHGGVVELDVTRTSHLYAVQLYIPTLREASWRVFANHVTNIAQVPANELVEMGVPRDLVQRISAVPGAVVTSSQWMSRDAADSDDDSWTSCDDEDEYVVVNQLDE